MNVRFKKYYGKHPKIKFWFDFTIIPGITIARCNDFIANKPVMVLFIKWLFWSIEFNNNKSY